MNGDTSVWNSSLITSPYLCFIFIALTKALCPYHYIDSNFENIWNVVNTEPTVHLSNKKLNGKKAKLNVMIVEQDIYSYTSSLIMLWHFIIHCSKFHLCVFQILLIRDKLPSRGQLSKRSLYKGQWEDFPFACKGLSFFKNLFPLMYKTCFN